MINISLLLKTDEYTRPPIALIPLPDLPTSEPLPQDKTDHFDSVVERAVDDLQNDFTSGARQLADASLKHLIHITDIAACMATSWGDLWALMVHAAKQLSCARPSMSAAITACLLRALEQIARLWNDEQIKGSQSTSDLARIAATTFDKVLMERQELGVNVGRAFTRWLRKHSREVMLSSLTFDEAVGADTHQWIQASDTVRILTLSNSSTIRTAILHAMAALPDMFFHITVLESRPRCEGADMAAHIYASANKDHLSIRVVPDCAVGSAAQDIDVVLLGADRISSTGDVSNKIGSLAATLCAKRLNDNVAVIALSDVDKIASPGHHAVLTEEHPSSELTSTWSPATRDTLEGKPGVEVLGEWFEWVPSVYIDAYVTERGLLETQDVERISREVEHLDEFIFQHEKD